MIQPKHLIFILRMFGNYLIKKGKHRSGFYFSPQFDIKHIKRKILFKENCIYKFGDIDDFDINKLFGVSFGMHHTNSVRFGWNIDDDEIGIYNYCYISGKRVMIKIVSIPTETNFVFEIFIYDSYYELKITDMNGKLIGWSEVSKPKTTKWGYHLFPYFGGNKVAPHNMEICMKKIN